jgi:hypothetical protein
MHPSSSNIRYLGGFATLSECSVTLTRRVDCGMRRDTSAIPRTARRMHVDASAYHGERTIAMYMLTRQL